MRHLTDRGFCAYCGEMMEVVKDWEPIQFDRITGEATKFQRKIKCESRPTFWQRFWGEKHSDIIQTKRSDGTITEIDLAGLVEY